MANIKQQKKRVIQNERNRVRNVSFTSKMKTAIKKVRLAVENEDLESAEKLLPEAISLIDKSVKGGFQKMNTAARQKSHLMTSVNLLRSKVNSTPAE